MEHSEQLEPLRRRLKSAATLCACIALLAACNRSGPADDPELALGDAATEEAAPSDPAVVTALDQTELSLQQGAYDDAAAELARLQASGHNFSPQEAARFRQAMQEAYSRALEEAEKGDPRAQAALQMLRKARGR